MASEEKVYTITKPASGDLSANQYKFVLVNSSAQVALQTTAGDPCAGVQQDTPAAAGRATSVAYGGVSKVIAGGSITAGAQVMSNDAGLAVTATTGNFAMGIALTGASASDVIPVLLLGPAQLN